MRAFGALNLSEGGVCSGLRRVEIFLLGAWLLFGLRRVSGLVHVHLYVCVLKHSGFGAWPLEEDRSHAKEQSGMEFPATSGKIPFPFRGNLMSCVELHAKIKEPARGPVAEYCACPVEATLPIGPKVVPFWDYLIEF